MEEKMKTKKGKLKVIVEKTNTGFSAYADKYPVFTAGETIAELTENAVDAFNLYYDDEGIEVKASNIELYFDLELFFKYYPVINSRYLADRIGMHPTLLSQYVNGKKKASDKQTKRIMLGIHEIGKELSELNLMA